MDNKEAQNSVSPLSDGQKPTLAPKPKLKLATKQESPHETETPPVSPTVEPSSSNKPKLKFLVI